MSEAFLSRWSRLKQTGGEAEVAEPLPVAAPIDAENPVIPAAQNAPISEEIVQNLPPIESLNSESDYAAFMQPKVPDALKRQALKKLFAEPQFNVMDGLDVYVDDYSISVPIPDDWYKDIPSWQAMLNPKPPMVVTDGGYAVEADSEEGLATMAARAEKDPTARLDESVKPIPSPSIPTSQGEGSLEPLSLGERGRGEGVGVSTNPLILQENLPLDVAQEVAPEITPDKTKPKQ
jgi:Protein of unknown function (DUF3306)